MRAFPELQSDTMAVGRLFDDLFEDFQYYTCRKQQEYWGKATSPR